MKKELHSSPCLWSFKNTQGLKLHFAGLQISDKELHRISLFGNFKPTLRNLVRGSKRSNSVL